MAMPNSDQAGSTLARLSFWVPPERLDDFAEAYERKLAPILQERELMESSERGRATPDGVFTCLFAFEAPAEIAAAERGLRADPKWQEVLRELGAIFASGAALCWQFCVY